MKVVATEQLNMVITQTYSSARLKLDNLILNLGLVVWAAVLASSQSSPHAIY